MFYMKIMKVLTYFKIKAWKKSNIYFILNFNSLLLRINDN